jgi:hypothetical protein
VFFKGLTISLRSVAFFLGSLFPSLILAPSSAVNLSTALTLFVPPHG